MFSFSKIVLNYLKGRFFIDVIATIPYEFFAPYNSVLIREFRVYRIGSVFALLDIQRYSKLLYHLISDGSREQRIIINFMMTNVL